MYNNNNLHNFQLSIVLILSKYQIEIILNSLNDKNLHFQSQIVVYVEDLQVCVPLVKYILSRSNQWKIRSCFQLSGSLYGY